MKKICTLLFITLNFLIAQSQSVGIGTTSPNTSSQLDVTSTTKGLLIPRMTTPGITSISNPAKGLMVYDSLKNQLMINMGTPAIPNFQNVVVNSGWGLKGNSGTNPAVNFIGTTDNRPLRFGINKIAAGFIDSASTNSFYGFSAGSKTKTAFGNAGLGYKALDSIAVGSYNTAVGDSVLFNTTGLNALYNTAIGSQALAGNNSYCTAGGYQSLNEVQNIATGFGSYALAYNSKGIGTVIGHSAMSSPVSSSVIVPLGSNLAIGSAALLSSTGGGDIAIGYAALLNEPGTVHLVAIGDSALYHNFGKSECVAIGSAALWLNAGRFNTATGLQSLYQTGNNSSATAIGYQAGYNGGDYNTATGCQSMALRNNILTANNSTLGRHALFNNSIGTGNTAAGAETLFYNTTGNNNVALGFNSLYYNTVASGNTAAGVNAQYFATLGANTGIGGNTLMNTTASMYNTAVGYNSGSKYNMGYNNTMVGANCDISGPGLYNCVAIGQDVTCTDVSQVRIGNLATYSIGGYAGWTVISDGRMKKEVEEKVIGLDFIMKLRPVTYQLDLNALNNHLKKGTKKMADSTSARAIAQKEQKRYTGFIAQEVESAAKQANYNFSGLEKPGNDNSTYGLRYDEFISPIIKALQEQQQIIQTLKKQNADIIQVNKEEDDMYQQLLSKIMLLESKPAVSKN
ncbi:MAG TPA: tail fiber domain-containing protein [Chitinophagaceae bacterium]|nr:tail fiber domain-containing protein [Chitinophagaceae bacterium]